MGMPSGIGIVDTMIGFPEADFAMYDKMKAAFKDPDSKDAEFPAEYMFKNVPKEVYGASDPVAVTLKEMDRWGIEYALVAVDNAWEDGKVAERACKEHPDRFIAHANLNPNAGVEGLRRMVRLHEAFGLKAFAVFPCGLQPQVGLDEALMYPVYAKCVELGVPLFANAGIPGPRFPMWPQEVARLDKVMYDFPELVLVTRHGCEPWEDLAVKLMVKWPNLYFSTSAFAPKFYPKAVIDYANTRGADKIIYGGYWPMGLSLERIMGELQNVPFKDHVWPKFLRENALRVLKIGQ